MTRDERHALAARIRKGEAPAFEYRDGEIRMLGTLLAEVTIDDHQDGREGWRWENGQSLGPDTATAFETLSMAIEHAPLQIADLVDDWEVLVLEYLERDERPTGAS